MGTEDQVVSSRIERYLGDSQLPPYAGGANSSSITSCRLACSLHAPCGGFGTDKRGPIEPLIVAGLEHELVADLGVCQSGPTAGQPLFGFDRAVSRRPPGRSGWPQTAQAGAAAPSARRCRS